MSKSLLPQLKLVVQAVLPGLHCYEHSSNFTFWSEIVRTEEVIEKVREGMERRGDGLVDAFGP